MQTTLFEIGSCCEICGKPSTASVCSQSCLKKFDEIVFGWTKKIHNLVAHNKVEIPKPSYKLNTHTRK